MSAPDRRAIIRGLSTIGAALGIAGCATTPPVTSVQNSPPSPQPSGPEANVEPAHATYGPIGSERFPIPAVKLSDVNPAFLRKTVPYATAEPPGTIVIDPPRHYLYLVNRDGQ